MKKIILILLLAFAFNQISKAQIDLCKNPCPPGPLKWKTIPLCTFSKVVDIDLGGGNILQDPLTNVPFVFVTIGYRE